MNNFIDILTGTRPEDRAHGYIMGAEDVIAYPYYHGTQRYIFVDTPSINGSQTKQCLRI